MTVIDYDPRIVDLYDEDNPDGPDHDFYRSLADDAEAQTILDLGCGTGMLTVTLANGSRRVVGAERSPAMIAFARSRPGAERVTWIEGDSSSAPQERFDLAVMSGNVVQHITDGDWARTLQDLRARMGPGGILTFESRNPNVREWETWASAERTSRETQHGTLLEWMEVHPIDERTVRLDSHNLFVDTGHEVTMSTTLVFRSCPEIERDLRSAEFSIDAVYSDWFKTPFDETARLMVFTANAH